MNYNAWCPICNAVDGKTLSPDSLVKHLAAVHGAIVRRPLHGIKHRFIYQCPLCPYSWGLGAIGTIRDVEEETITEIGTHLLHHVQTHGFLSAGQFRLQLALEGCG